MIKLLLLLLSGAKFGKLITTVGSMLVSIVAFGLPAVAAPAVMKSTPPVKRNVQNVRMKSLSFTSSRRSRRS